MKTPKQDRSRVLRKSLEQVRRNGQASSQPPHKSTALPWLIGGAGTAAVAGVLVYGLSGDAETPATEPAAPLTLAPPLAADDAATVTDAVAATTTPDSPPDAADTAQNAQTAANVTESTQTAQTAQTAAEPTLTVTIAPSAADTDTIADTDVGNSTDSEDLREELRALRENKTRLQAERDRLSQTLDAARSELEQTRSQLDEYQQLTVNTTRQLGEAEQQIDRLKTRVPVDDDSVELAQLREKLAAVQLKADSATGVVNEVARKLYLDFDLENWSGDKSAENTLRTALIDRIDQSLAGKNAYSGAAKAPAAGGYSNAIHNGNAERLRASLLALKPKRRNPNFSADDIKLEQVHFSSGSNALTVGGQRKTALIAKLFAQEKLQKLKVVGFSDTVGNAALNKTISERRAQSVADSLVAAGVPRDRIEVIGSGEENLPEPTQDGVNEPLNRCVAIVATQ